jgi:hypothetical protein
MQLDFGFSSKSLSDFELTMNRNRACDHSPEALAPFLPHTDGRATVPLEFLGNGASRETYALPCGKHVLKLNLHRYDWEQMHSEIQCWQLECDKEIRKLLCPIDAFDPDGAYIVMRRAEMSSSLLSLTNVLGKGLSDLHEDNVGILNGNTIVIDYGTTGSTFTWDTSAQLHLNIGDN